MGNSNFRLYFIDAMRAWAILMMLQGHFVDGLLDPVFRDPENTIYTTWKYFRGITAPVFFTVSGFIFTYLLIKNNLKGWENPRVKKGIKRGIQLIFIGYLLRLNVLGLLGGHIYPSFYLVDVLHCIGLSILLLISIYLYSAKKKSYVFSAVLLISTLIIFLLEPAYKNLPLSFLPDFAANYFTKINGSVFTIFPWFGYAAFGAFMATIFNKYKHQKYLYPTAISLCLLFGFTLIFYSSKFFLTLFSATGIQVFADVFNNNYLFIRLGDVLVVFAVFMLIRSLLTNTIILKIGQNTLAIYVIHFIILYGSFTGLGLYKFFHHSVQPYAVVSGAVLFMVVTTFLALRYDKHEIYIKTKLNAILNEIKLALSDLVFIIIAKVIQFKNWLVLSFKKK